MLSNLQTQVYIRKKRYTFRSGWRIKLGSFRVVAKCPNLYIMPHSISKFFLPSIQVFASWLFGSKARTKYLVRRTNKWVGKSPVTGCSGSRRSSNWMPTVPSLLIEINNIKEEHHYLFNLSMVSPCRAFHKLGSFVAEWKLLFLQMLLVWIQMQLGFQHSCHFAVVVGKAVTY